MPLTPPAVAVRDLAVQYGAERVLQDVTFTIEPGELVGIVGPNGSGKTTLLRACLGLAPAASGTVSLFGADVKRFRDWSRLAYVAQNAAYRDRSAPATVREVVSFGRVARRGLLRRLDRHDDEHVRAALREVALAGLERKRFTDLSGGQRQRVLLAKALAGEPEAVFLDEPTTGVDPKAREEFYRLLDHLNHEHSLTVVLVSHDETAVARTAHRVLAVNRRLVFDGTPKEFEKTGGAHGAYDFHVPHHEKGAEAHD